jgi:hypothetical protein
MLDYNAAPLTKLASAHYAMFFSLANVSDVLQYAKYEFKLADEGSHYFTNKNAWCI